MLFLSSRYHHVCNLDVDCVFSSIFYTCITFSSPFLQVKSETCEEHVKDTWCIFATNPLPETSAMLECIAFTCWIQMHDILQDRSRNVFLLLILLHREYIHEIWSRNVVVTYFCYRSYTFTRYVARM